MSHSKREVREKGRRRRRVYRISRKLSFSLPPILEGKREREREGGARTGVQEIETKLKFVCNFEQKGLSLVSARLEKHFV